MQCFSADNHTFFYISDLDFSQDGSWAFVREKPTLYCLEVIVGKIHGDVLQFGFVSAVNSSQRYP